VGGPTTDCTPFACENAVCATSCSSNTDCAPSYSCKTNVCQ
jgi:hypothetical protein